MRPNQQETADLVTFTEEILDGKSFCTVWQKNDYFLQKIIWQLRLCKLLCKLLLSMFAY